MGPQNKSGNPSFGAVVGYIQTGPWWSSVASSSQTSPCTILSCCLCSTSHTGFLYVPLASQVLSWPRALPRIPFLLLFPSFRSWRNCHLLRYAFPDHPKLVSFSFIVILKRKKKIWSRPGSSEKNPFLIRKQGSFLPALLCLLYPSLTHNKLSVPLPGTQHGSTWHGNHFLFYQAALSRTLVNPLYLTSPFTLGKGTAKMRTMQFCHKVEGKRTFMVSLDPSKPAPRGGAGHWAPPLGRRGSTSPLSTPSSPSFQL